MYFNRIIPGGSSGLLVKRGRPVAVLGPGWRLFGIGELYALKEGLFSRLLPPRDLEDLPNGLHLRSIATNEVAVIFLGPKGRHPAVQQVEGPATFWFFASSHETHLEVFKIGELIRDTAIKKKIMASLDDLPAFATRTISPGKMGLIQRRTSDWVFLEEGVHLFCKGSLSLDMDESFDIEGDVFFTHPKIAEIVRSPAAGFHLQSVLIDPQSVGWLFGMNGTLHELEPGWRAWWRKSSFGRLEIFELRQQEIRLSKIVARDKDGRSWRVHCNWQIKIEKLKCKEMLEELADWRQWLRLTLTRILRDNLGQLATAELETSASKLMGELEKSTIPNGRALVKKVQLLELEKDGP